ncbi:hypothetical protein BJV82DRAFT_611495 [Fennellomyces sp. T-0311]|nr:hypothetical protein BJV82DRAFT_611495 [Fennellomyces sp. T-0311]
MSTFFNVLLPGLVCSCFFCPCLTTDSINSVLLVCSGLSSAAASKSPIGASRSTVTLGAYVVLGYPLLLP